MARPKLPAKKKARISPTDALRIFLPELSAHEAALQLTLAVHGNKCQLWCNGNLLPVDYVANSLRVVARTEPDGRWRAEVVSSVREAWEGKVYSFEFDADEVTALLPRAKAEPQPLELRRPRGKPPTKDWPVRVAVELGRRWERGEGPTAPDMCQWAVDNLGLDIDEGDMRRLMSRAAKKK